MLSASVSLEKRLHYDGNMVYNATSGTSSASISASATVSGFATHGDYYIKAKARGLLWYRSEKLSDSYNNGTHENVSKDAIRLSGSPTWSGVHLWGKAEVDNQFGDVEVIFEWL